jgi:hypothetical protein
MAKQKTIGDYWNDIPAPIKLGAYAIGGFMLYGKIKKEIAEYKAAQLKLDATNPIYTTPGGVTTLPGGTPITTPDFNYAQKAQSIYYLYNPTGWTSDEAGILNVLASVPGDKFKLVANYYNQTYSRDLIADLNGQLVGIWLQPWTLYKTQIV